MAHSQKIKVKQNILKQFLTLRKLNFFTIYPSCDYQRQKNGLHESRSETIFDSNRFQPDKRMCHAPWCL